MGDWEGSYTGSCGGTHTQSLCVKSSFNPVSVPLRLKQNLSGEHVKSPTLRTSLNVRPQQMALLQGCHLMSSFHDKLWKKQNKTMDFESGHQILDLALSAIQWMWKMTSVWASVSNSIPLIALDWIVAKDSPSSNIL